MALISAATVKMKFAEFANQPDGMIELAIEEASRSVDDTWGNDEKLGLLYMTAHILMVTISRASSASGQQISSESIPGVYSVTYSMPPQPTEMSIDDLTTTPYGMRYKDLATRNFPAVLVI